MTPQKVIITDHLHHCLADWLRQVGYSVEEAPEITNEELADCIDRFTGLALSTRIMVTPALIDKASKLQFIARAGSGMENIDIAYALQKDIVVVNSPEGNANAVGEHAVGMLLALVNNIARADRELRNGIWRREENRGLELRGRTIGIIGFGHTGKAFASKLRGFDVRILAHDKYIAGFSDENVLESTLEAVCNESDVISFHLPLNPETKHYGNAAFFANCKKKVRILNTSRGGIIHTGELLSALESGHLAGAALDVYENEQFYALPEDDQIWMRTLMEREDTVLTPHIAGWSFESYFNLSKILTEKLSAHGFPRNT